MAKSLILSFTLFLSALISRVAAQTESAADLQVAVLAAKDDRGGLVIPHHDGFNVRLTNRSNKPIQLWDKYSQPGHDTLSFRITDHKGNSWMMRKAPLAGNWDDYAIKTITIAAGATYVWRVVPLEFQAGRRSWTGMPEPNGGDEFTIVPLFEIKPDEQSRKKSVWTGRVEGQAVKVRVVNPELITPHELLWNQCPKEALKIMQADPTWINKKEPEYQCTPLHHASRFGFLEVVDWLLANGADVDARAYNDFSPLYFADEPAVVRSLLRHKPKEKERAYEFFRYPLEHAAEQVAWGGTDVQKWREIVKLMLDAGAQNTLQVAAYLDDFARVREALKVNPRLANALEGSQFTPLRIAAMKGRTEICRILLENKADPNDWENGQGFPILVHAIEHPEVVKLLLDAGADVKTRITWLGFKSGRWIIDDGATALHFAAKHGALETAKLLLGAGIDVNVKDTNGQTALDIAARCNQGEVAHLIADRMATPEAREKGWRTFLHQLVFSAQTDRLKQVLQDKGVADIFAREGPGFMVSAASAVVLSDTRRHQQENERNYAIIKSLKENGIPIDIYSAITCDDIARVKELLKSDPALAKSKDQDKRPVLNCATSLGRRAIIVLLLNAGADANEPDPAGDTALHCAAFWNQPEIANVLIERRAEVNARAKNGFTPLHEAARLGSVAVAQLLLAAGANVDAMDKEGRKPLYWALIGDEPDMIDLLLKNGGKK
jgi:ankyrin repeat protein